jgi:hypothetical protein
MSTFFKLQFHDAVVIIACIIALAALAAMGIAGMLPGAV